MTDSTTIPQPGDRRLFGSGDFIAPGTLDEIEWVTIRSADIHYIGGNEMDPVRQIDPNNIGCWVEFASSDEVRFGFIPWSAIGAIMVKAVAPYAKPVR